MKKKELTFEERIARIQAIVTALESGESPLEESVALYKEGLFHVASCRRQLEKARNDIRLCTQEGTEPFAQDTEEEE